MAANLLSILPNISVALPTEAAVGLPHILPSCPWTAAVPIQGQLPNKRHDTDALEPLGSAIQRVKTVGA